jgi:hypothetical protein
MNADPKIRVVGKRKPSNYNSGGLKAGDNLLRLLRDLRGSRPYVPHGVYRFKSHEESDAWMMKMLTRATAAPRP